MANTKNMKMKKMNEERRLEGKGEMSYDFANDILFFKVSEREYGYSLEFQNIVIDIDSESFIVGIQLFDASKFLGIERTHLRQIPRWKFEAKVVENVVEIRLYYQIELRNKIVEKNPIIIQQNTAALPSPQLVVAK